MQEVKHGAQPVSPWVQWGLPAAAVAFYLWPALTSAYHCDEFNVMRHVTDFAMGDFHGAGRPGLFFWLLIPTTWLPSPDSAMIAARLVMLVATYTTFALVIHLAARAAGPRTAPIFAWALLAGSGSFVSHAFEIRTDTLVLPCVLGVVALICRADAKVRDFIIAGLLIGISGAISQKSLYNAVAIGTGFLAFIALTDGAQLRANLRTRAIQLAAMVGVSVIVVVLYYTIMGLLSGQGTEYTKGSVDVAVATAFHKKSSMHLKWKWVRTNYQQSWYLYSLALVGAVYVLANARKYRVAVVLTVIGIVMASTVLVHRGFYLYYIASMEPYWAVGAGLVIAQLVEGRLKVRLHDASFRGRAIFLLILTILVGPTYRHVRAMHTLPNDPQVRVMRVVDATFDEPIRYWDGIGMIAGEENIGGFLTGFQRDRVRRVRPMAFLDDWRTHQPEVFVRTYMSRMRYLKTTEQRWWRNHAIYYRPNVYLLGARVPLVPDRALPFEIIRSGTYTVWIKGHGVSLTIDGQAVRDGTSLHFEAGPHVVEVQSHDVGPTDEVRLLLGADRHRDAGWHEVDYSMFPMLNRTRLQRYDDKGEESDLLSPHAMELKDQERRIRDHQAWRDQQDQQFREDYFKKLDAALQKNQQDTPTAPQSTEPE